MPDRRLAYRINLRYSIADVRGVRPRSSHGQGDPEYVETDFLSGGDEGPRPFQTRPNEGQTVVSSRVKPGLPELFPAKPG